MLSQQFNIRKNNDNKKIQIYAATLIGTMETVTVYVGMPNAMAMATLDIAQQDASSKAKHRSKEDHAGQMPTL